MFIVRLKSYDDEKKTSQNPFNQLKDCVCVCESELLLSILRLENFEAITNIAFEMVQLAILRGMLSHKKTLVTLYPPHIIFIEHSDKQFW